MISTKHRPKIFKALRASEWLGFVIPFMDFKFKASLVCLVL